MIVLVGNERDLHILRVRQELERLGAQSVVLDFERFGELYSINVSISNDKPMRAVVSFRQGELASEDISALWLRRARLPSLPKSVPDPDDRRFALNEWRATTDTLAQCARFARILNSPTAERAASKPRQLQVASDVGLRIPSTLITDSVVEAKSFAARFQNKIIHKVITTPEHLFPETRRWSEQDESMIELLPLAPVLLQEEIVGVGDLRITFVAERLYTALLESRDPSGVDSRLEFAAPYLPFTLPAATTDRILALMHELGLDFGTIDMKLLPTGECVFFEVNPQGQFLYIEVHTGLPIAGGLAEVLAGKAADGPG